MEFDDHQTSIVDKAEVLNKEAYILFYIKKSQSTDAERDIITKLLSKEKALKVYYF